MSFFTDPESETLRIDSLILHVVGHTDETFEPQTKMDSLDNADFFLERIRGSATSPIHSFNERSTVKSELQKIAENPAVFEEVSQELSRKFTIQHSGTSSDGAFFVVKLNCDDRDQQFFCLVKYDYREAIELYEKDGSHALRQIVQAFVKERSAIQKFCLIRASRGVVQSEVSASDRTGKSPDLTQYYEAFLDVTRSLDDDEMSKNLREVIRSTAEQIKQILPQHDVIAAINTVNDMLRGRESVEHDDVEEAFFVAAGRPDDENTVNQLNKVIERQLKQKRLEGVAFRPEQGIFARPPVRRVKTAEGVDLRYPTELQGHLVKERTHADGSQVIEITTESPYAKDETVQDKSRR